MRRFSRFVAPLALACTLGAAPLAMAAGLGRPNVLGARAIGLGGAFTAVADDPTAVWHNPAGIGFSADNVAYLGGELIVTQRSYTPSASSPLGAAGQTQKITENTTPTALPIVGATTRFAFGKQKPNRFALGIAAYDVYGGSIGFDPADVKNLGIVSTRILDYEIAPALAYQVTDVLSLGAALRVGINSFSVDDREAAYSANVSASGVGIGGAFGLMVRPHPRVQIGAVYRTPLSSTMTGSGVTALTASTTPPASHDASVSISWPQSASLGIAVKPLRRIMATVQGDWTGWSSVQSLDINLAGMGPQVRPMRYADSYALHVGVEGVITHYLLARLGWALDTNAIPDSTMRRENEDSLKSTIAVGVGVHLWKLFIDGAFETFLPIGGRTVATQVGTDNEAGYYYSHIYTAELSVQMRF